MCARKQSLTFLNPIQIEHRDRDGGPGSLGPGQFAVQPPEQSVQHWGARQRSVVAEVWHLPESQSAFSKVRPALEPMASRMRR